MYFRFQRRQQLLTVKDNFAHLRRIGNRGDLYFEFTYTVSQREVINHGALKVDIKVELQHVPPKPLLGESHRGFIDTRALVKNVRTAMIDAKSAVQQRQRYQIATRSSDITAHINNEILPQLRARTPIAEILHFNRPRLQLVPASEVKANNDPQPILHRIAYSQAIPDLQLALTASNQVEPQHLMHDMILRQGLDPSQIFELAPRVHSEHITRGGLSNPQRAVEHEWDPTVRLLHYHLFPPIFDVPPSTTQEVGDTELVQVLQTVSSDDADVTVPVTVPVSKLRLDGRQVSRVHVVFELIDSRTNLAIDTITKELDLSRHIHVYHTPKRPPQVKAAASEISTRINLEIKQLDPGATEVEVYKKAFWVSSPETDDYTLVGTYPLTVQDQSLLIQVDKPINSPALYRVIPKGKQSVQGFEYTNVAVRPARYTPTRAVSLTAHQIDTGIQLEVRHLPTKVVAVQFLRWNLTTFEDEPTTVGDDVGFIDESTRRADLITVIDSDVAYDNVYQYMVKLIYKDGHTVEAGDATAEFIKPSPGEVDTKIENLVVTHDNVPNVTFTINTQIVDTDIDAVKKMLEAQGMANYFAGDVANQRDELKKLIAHRVYRTDLNTGHTDNFGVLTTPDFDDEALRKNQAIGPLEYGHKYRYIVYPLLRNPETLFDNFRKDVVDAVTKKPYSFFPAKFLHPHTLKRGIIVSSRGASLRYAKEPMSHGIIGSISRLEVSFDEDSASVIEPLATNFDRYLNVVTWKVLGDIHQVDHFLIMKEVHGIRSPLGKAHAEFSNGHCQFMHRISRNDVGALQYVIIPIYNDYRVGHHAVTNTLIVEGF